MSLRMMVYMCMLSLVLVIARVSTLDQKGSQFMLSFMQSSKTGGDIIVIITAETATNVTIHAPSISSSSFDSKFLTVGETWKVKLDNSLRVTTTFTKLKQAVSIRSDYDVTVYVMDVVDVKTSSGYLALPYHALSNSYVAVTYGGVSTSGSTAYPTFLVVALHDSTSVDIRYVLESGGSCDGDMTGDTLNRVLNAYEVYGVSCTGDFTGTQIVSDNPIVVISGHGRAAIGGKDIIQEMLLPVKYFGLEYVLVSHVGYNMGSVNRVVATVDNTVVMSSAGDHYSLNAYEYVDIDTGNSGPLCISSNFLILVVSFGKGNGVAGEEFMSFVPDTSMFSPNLYAELDFTTELSTSQTFYVALVVDRNEYSVSFGFGGTHEEIAGCRYDVYTVAVSSWPVTFNTGIVNIGAFTYGYHGDGEDGIGFPLKFQLRQSDVSSSAVVVSSTVSSAVVDVSATQIRTTQTLLRTMDRAVENGSPVGLSTDNMLYIASSTESIADSAVVNAFTDLTAHNTNNLSFAEPTMADTIDIVSSTGTDSTASVIDLSFHSTDIRTSFIDSTMDARSSDDMTSALHQAMDNIAQTILSEDGNVQSMCSTSGGVCQSSAALSPSRETTPSDLLLTKNVESTSSPSTTTGIQLNMSSDRFQSVEMVTENIQSDSVSREQFLTKDINSLSFADVLTSETETESSVSEIKPTTISNFQTSMPSAPLIPGFQVPGSTSCVCCGSAGPMNVTEEMLRQLRLKVRDHLLLETSNLSKTVRKLTSARDDRASAAGFGCTGVTFLVLMCAVMILFDLMRCFTHRYGIYSGSGKDTQIT